MRNPFFFLMTTLIILSLYSCRDNLPIFTLPEIELEVIEVRKLDSLHLEAEIKNFQSIQNTDGQYREWSRGFILVEEEDETSGITLIAESNNNTLKFSKDTLDLGLNRPFWVLAFIDIINNGNKEIRRFFSTAVPFSTAGILLNTNIADFNNGILFLNGSISGLDSAEIQQYGHLWMTSDIKLNKEELDFRLNTHSEINITKNLDNRRVDGIYEDQIVLSQDFLGGYVYSRAYAVYKGQAVYSNHDEALFGDFWEKLSPKNDENLPIDLAEGVGFSVGGVGYIGLGRTGNGIENVPENLNKKFWTYHPNDDGGYWQEMLNEFPGEARKLSSGFVIDSCIYVGLGTKKPIFSSIVQLDSTNVFKDFFQYNTKTKEWNKMADFPTYRAGATAFSLNGKGYIAFGMFVNSSNRSGFSSVIYEFLPPNYILETGDTIGSKGLWKRKEKNALVQGISQAIAFSDDDYGYVGTGLSYGNRSSANIYKFDPSSMTNDTSIYLGKWDEFSIFDGGRRYSALSFQLGQDFYIGTGADLAQPSFKDLWKFDRQNQQWVQKADIFSRNLSHAQTFVIDNKAYVYGGYSSIISIEGDLWVYTPD